VTTRAKRSWAVRAAALLTIAVAVVFALAHRGGGGGGAGAPRATGKGACTLARGWYPPALPGTRMQVPPAQARVKLLQQFGLTGAPAQVVVDTDGGGKMVAALFAVTGDADGLVSALDATRPHGARVSQPLNGVWRVESSSGAFEYGRKGCAVMLAVGAARDIDPLMAALWAQR
jgi:hypothetical protein